MPPLRFLQLQPALVPEAIPNFIISWKTIVDLKLLAKDIQAVKKTVTLIAALNCLKAGIRIDKIK